ncbi:MAG TPA: cadmium resistance transporter [Acidimicrobiales bacterium]|nr:cadmium resistance transporter [Acidimicrobiales bacterium]
MAAGLGADLGVAAAAFVGTNVDNCVVTMTMVDGAPLERARRIAAGQVFGFVALVAVAAAAAALLFEFSTAVVGLLGLVPLALGLHGLVGLARSSEGGGGAAPEAERRTTRRKSRREPEERAVGRSFTAAALVTIAAGGDNLAVYIPLFRVGGWTNLGAVATVFVVGEALVTWLILGGGRHPRARGAMRRLGHVAVPILLCCVGVLVLVQAGTFSLLRPGARMVAVPDVTTPRVRQMGEIKYPKLWG